MTTTAPAGTNRVTIARRRCSRPAAWPRASGILGLSLVLLALSGCTTYGVVDNESMPTANVAGSYSLARSTIIRPIGDVLLMLAFSGGGTRAAALSYGVLQELRETPVPGGRLLDEVDRISSVSGGSFTAAYYGLHGDGVFDDFEDVFLKRDVEGALFFMLLNPLGWLSPKGRTDMAVDYYERTIFKGATFKDMLGPDRPLVIINASDLGRGVRFSFVQEYFSLLCSDLSSFSVARAVTASSAVPVLFQPVVVENFADCAGLTPEWLVGARQRVGNNPEMAMLVSGVESYLDKDRRRYVHFVDGGITDNLGLRSIYEIVELAGGPRAALNTFEQGKAPRRLVLLSVDASTEPQPEMDRSNAEPSIEQAIDAMSDVQLHRYNIETTDLIERSLASWQAHLSTPAQPVDTFFIRLDRQQIANPKERQFLNAVPTSFKLSAEQVDRLIAARRRLVRENPELRRLLQGLGKDPGGEGAVA